MRILIATLALAGAAALASCETTGYGGSSQLSQCGRNAIVGAVVGGIIGNVTAPRGNRTENTVGGAVIGGLATYGVCSWLEERDRANIERGYQQALSENRQVSSSWQGDQGDNRSVYVNTPAPSDQGPQCRRISATVQGPNGREQLPPETYCQNASGEWVPI